MRAPDLRRDLKIAISLIYYVAKTICQYSLRFVGRPSGQRLTILYYHGVAVEWRSSFARQMKALHRRAIIVPASYRGKLPVEKNKKCVAITFDDAFVSVAGNALPELNRYSFHSTIFVPVGWVGRTPGWALETGAGSAEQPELSEHVMSPEQLRALSVSSVSLGSHTMTHPPLAELEPERARDEVERSRLLLAQLSGREILELSFPYGNHDESTVALCRVAGYEMLYSIIPEEVDTRRLELLRGRTKVDPSDGPIEFFLKFNGAYEWMRYSIRLRKAFRSMFSTKKLREPRQILRNGPSPG
jgi:peptidoglycan/xylan/chitin deacetylase (PgdA/CDA1 family)